MPTETTEAMSDLPNICGQEEQVEQAMRRREPVYAPESNLQWDRIHAVFAIALHMHQPLVPAGGDDLRNAEIISNLDFMMRHPDIGDNHNAPVFAECYARMGEIIRELVNEGRNPRVMLDFSGTLLHGLRRMGRGDVLERLRPLACDPSLRRYAEWLGTLWGHAVIPSTPPPDFRLHMRAWQHEFAALYGYEALNRVRGFSPPEMHLPNHPDVSYEYVKALKECGYRWLLVQEHTVETLDGGGLRERYLPCRLRVKNSLGEELTITAIIKTQGSDTKLVAQMQPFYEAQTMQRREVGGRSVSPLVVQIGDGENGGVMMNEFPSAYRQAIYRLGTDGVTNAHVTEYLELLERSGVPEDVFPEIRPIRQSAVLSRIRKWEPGAADAAIGEIRRECPDFGMEGGSWTNNISWVRGYENVLTPMNRLSADFHRIMDSRKPDTGSRAYRNALYHLLVSQTSCFRYWGQGMWVEYAREICRRGSDILKYDFH
jgi:hypothetical protein